MIINDLERTLGPFQMPLHLFIKVKMLKSHTENELISTFEDTEKMLYVVCLIKSYRKLNCAIDLPKILGNYEHRQEYISCTLQQDDFTQYAFPCLHQLQISQKKPHMAQYPRGSPDEADTSKFRGRTPLKRMPGMCKKQDRKGNAKNSIR
jgi:hypothetical protein